ncbi:mitotic spindle checkpoint protein Bub3 [Elasticomyces elasticus]|uniref:Mitotic spindle checkpoint protein Bub3 n=1 Tax=Elasticomyces elasticus TaxID=574655 RepID=A0AAN7VP97_9PEZI|nr:mitotic spindle checkpoint protein Bub3 [Elasticomyces elasticus]
MSSSSTPQDLADPPTDAISSLRFSPSNNTLAVASWDCTISLYNRTPETPETPFTFTGTRITCRAPILDIYWGSDDNTLYSVGLDYDVRSHDLQNPENEQSVLSTHEAASNKIAYSAQHDIVLSTSWDSTLHVHKPATGMFMRVPLPTKPFALSLTATRVVIAMAERKLWVYDLLSLATLVDQAGRTANGTGPNHDVTEIVPWQQRESSLKFMTRAVACMPDGQGFATSSIEGRVGVEFFDPGEQAKTYAFKCHRQTQTTTITNEPGPDGEAGEQEEREVDIVYPVNALAFHPVHGTFATGGGDGVVSVWDAQTKRRVKQYPKLGASVAAMEFSGDGKFLAIGVSPGFEDGKEDEEIQEGQVKIVVRELGENEVKGRPAK